jgi:hypothetical protein
MGRPDRQGAAPARQAEADGSESGGPTSGTEEASKLGADHGGDMRSRAAKR